MAITTKLILIVEIKLHNGVEQHHHQPRQVLKNKSLAVSSRRLQVLLLHSRKEELLGYHLPHSFLFSH